MYTIEEMKNADLSFEDARKKHAAWQREKLLKKYSSQAVEEIEAALREADAFITEGDVFGWLGGLYDAEVGGFYFSPSARDTDGFLPDLESTRQALSFFMTSGAGRALAPTLGEALPEWMKEDVTRFVKRLQDPENGYFYHPQWSRGDTDAQPGRLGRDLNWAVALLRDFGKRPTYDTPTGECGDGISYDGRPVAKPLLKSEQVPKAARPHLEDAESFIARLAEYEPQLATPNGAWIIGNFFESEAMQIVERDRRLKEMGSDTVLCDLLADWLGKTQDAESGSWTVEGDSYNKTNGILKICRTYNQIDRPFPNCAAALRTVIYSILDSSAADTVCHVLNPWYAVGALVWNASAFSSSTEEREVILSLRRYVGENAPAMIRATAGKLSRFRVGDGSFIYKPDRAGISQGMRVAPNGVFDGDVNATIIGGRAVMMHVYDAIGSELPPLYSGSDAMRFLNIIEEKKLAASKKIR